MDIKSVWRVSEGLTSNAEQLRRFNFSLLTDFGNWFPWSRSAHIYFKGGGGSTRFTTYLKRFVSFGRTDCLSNMKPRTQGSFRLWMRGRSPPPSLTLSCKNWVGWSWSYGQPMDIRFWQQSQWSCFTIIWGNLSLHYLNALFVCIDAVLHHCLQFNGKNGKRRTSTVFVVNVTSRVYQIYITGESNCWWILICRGQLILKKSGTHLKTPNGRWVTWSKFHIEDPQILGTVLANLLARATGCPGFVHPLLIWREIIVK